MQTGVGFTMDKKPQPTQPKFLRVGVNTALCDTGSLLKLLIDKGVITTDEIDKAMADGMADEVDRYRKELSTLYDSEITLI
jgi:hypothetical protein